MWHARAHIQGQRQEFSLLGRGSTFPRQQLWKEEAEAGAGDQSSMSCAAEALLNSNGRRRQGAGLVIIGGITPGMPSAPMSTPGQRDADNRVSSVQLTSAEGKLQLSNISQDNKKYSIWGIKCFSLPEAGDVKWLEISKVQNSCGCCEHKSDLQMLCTLWSISAWELRHEARNMNFIDWLWNPCLESGDMDSRLVLSHTLKPSQENLPGFQLRAGGILWVILALAVCTFTQKDWSVCSKSQASAPAEQSASHARLPSSSASWCCSLSSLLCPSLEISFEYS